MGEGDEIDGGGTETDGWIWARRVTLFGSSEALDDRKIALTSNLFQHFSNQAEHLGGHLLVQRDKGLFCATSFWETSAAMDRTSESARSAAARMCQTIWGRSGFWEIEIFQVIGLKPAARAVAIPDL